MDPLKNIQELQAQLIAKLKLMTSDSRVTWVKREADPELLYCFVDLEGKVELILFQFDSGDPDKPYPQDKAEGITAEFRNHTFLWLSLLDDFGWLVERMNSAPVDSARVTELRNQAVSSCREYLDSIE